VLAQIDDSTLDHFLCDSCLSDAQEYEDDTQNEEDVTTEENQYVIDLLQKMEL
jgi:hypothetical protein